VTHPADFTPALAMGLFGFARAGADLRLRVVEGRLLNWLPPVGAPLADSAVFFGLDAELAALRAGARPRIDLPGLRLPPAETPFALTVVCDPDDGDFLIYACADCGMLDFERQLAHERRRAQILSGQAEAAGRVLREQAALYRDIVENDGDLVLRLGRDLRITFVNPAARRMFDLAEGEMIGRPVDDLLQSSEPELWTARLRDDAAISFEHALRVGGETVWIWWRAHWVGAGAEYQAVGRDVTDLRRLRAEASARAEEARANAVIRERLRIAHALHDTLVHSLVALAPQIRLIRKTAGSAASSRLMEELGFAEQAVRDGLARARAAIADLRAQPLQPEGLASALETLARRFGEHTGLHVRVDLDARATTPDPDVAETFLQIAEEALRNAELHAQASLVSLRLTADRDGGASLEIADDGRGFEPDRAPEGHYGLVGMRERAEMIGARFSLESRPGGGARIVVEAPAAARATRDLT